MSITTPNQQGLQPHVVRRRPEGWAAYPPLYFGLVYIAGALPGVPWWAALLVGVVLAAIGYMTARTIWDVMEYGTTVSWAVTLLLSAVGLGTGVWLAAAYAVGALHVWQYLVEGGAICWACWALLMLVAPAAARHHDAQYPIAPPAPAPAVAPEAPETELVTRYRRLLAKLAKEVEVVDVTTSPSGGVEIVHLMVREDQEMTRATFDARLPRIATALARLYKTLGVQLQDTDVKTEAGANLAEWRLLVTVRPVLTATITYVPVSSPTPWCGPKKVGLWEDDRELELTLFDEQNGAAHLDNVMGTGGGKTGTVNTTAARHLESDEGEIWLVGAHKLVKVALPWLDPWLRGITDRPVLDRVAGEAVQPCLRALADALHFANLTNRRTRGNQARKPSRGKGGLLVILDEKSHLLKRTETIRCYDGVHRNASQIVAALTQLGRSAQVGVFTTNQDNLMGSAGSAGPEQQRNQAAGIVGFMKSGYDAYSTIALAPSQNPLKLRDHMVYVVSPYDEPRELRAKFQFIPDEQLPQLAALYTPYRFGLDPEITKHLLYYADRWDPQWHQELIADLEEDPELEYPVGPGGQVRMPRVNPPAHPAGDPGGAAGGPAGAPAGEAAGEAGAAPAHPATRPPAHPGGEPVAHPPAHPPAHPGARVDIEAALRAFAAFTHQPARADELVQQHRAGTLDPTTLHLACQLAASTAAPNPEVPAMPTPNDDSPEGLPDQFYGDDFDVLAALEAAAASGQPPAAPAAPAGAPVIREPGDYTPEELAASQAAIDNPDLSDLHAGLAKMRAYARREAERTFALPDPLGSVLRVLAMTPAEDLREGVPTVLLAIAIGRVARDAPDQEQNRAAAQLGLDLNRQTGLNAERLSKSIDPRRRNGFLVADLQDAGRRLADAA